MIRDFAPTYETVSQRFGRQLGRGAYRTAFAFGTDKVVKYERRPRSNNDEWAVWSLVKGTELEQYLCPMLSRSADGCTMIQAKVCRTVEMAEKKWNDRLNAHYYGERTLTPRMLDRLHKEVNAFRDEVQEFTRTVSKAFRTIGIIANDLHEGNIGIMSDGRFVVLDYGNFYAAKYGTTLQDLVGMPARDSASDYRSDSCQCFECQNGGDY